MTVAGHNPVAVNDAGPPPFDAPSSTPTLRAAARRAGFWVAAGVGALLVAIVGTVIAGGGQPGGPPLGADNPTPGGSRALVEVLRQHGVRVTAAPTLEVARATIATHPQSTLFLADEGGYLNGDQITEVLNLAPRTVVANPDFLVLDQFDSAIGFGGVSAAKTLSADCAVPAARHAATLSPGGRTLRLITPGAPGLTGCFPSGDNTFSVIEQVSDGGVVTLVAPNAVFSNDEIATFGNAALALNLLGASDSVIWYVPTLADVARSGPPSLGQLAPGWVTPVLLLLVLTALAAMVWRGRRFGPLVGENLPVIVRASETMEGRARLYARTSARLRAIDAVRIGTLQRLVDMTGLPRTASVTEIAQAVAALTRRPVTEVLAIVRDSLPRSDRDLLRLSDQLAQLEQTTARATGSATTHPAPPNRRMDQ